MKLCIHPFKASCVLSELVHANTHSVESSSRICAGCLQLCRRMEVRNADAPTLPDIVDARNTLRVVRALWALAEACAGQGLQAGALHAMYACPTVARCLEARRTRRTMLWPAHARPARQRWPSCKPKQGACSKQLVHSCPR